MGSSESSDTSYQNNSIYQKRINNIEQNFLNEKSQIDQNYRNKLLILEENKRKMEYEANNLKNTTLRYQQQPMYSKYSQSQYYQPQYSQSQYYQPQYSQSQYSQSQYYSPIPVPIPAPIPTPVPVPIPAPIPAPTPTPDPTPVKPQYTCHNFTTAEQSAISSGTSQQQVCTNGGNVFTSGNNANYNGCGNCWCCSPPPPPPPPPPAYTCHNFTTAEQSAISSGTSQQQVCTNGGNVFTSGNNANYNGCGGCWCCSKNTISGGGLFGGSNVGGDLIKSYDDDTRKSLQWSYLN